MADFLASIVGGGKQTAPQYQTYDPLKAQSQFLSQDFGKAQGISDNLTKNTSAANLGAFTTGLNQVDSGALAGINAEQNLGNTLLTGSGSALPAWARQYLNDAKMTGNESAIGRGVGAFSDNGISGVNQYVGNNAMNLVNLGAQFSNAASGQAGGIVNSNMYRNDPNSDLMTPGMFQQAGMFNTGIMNEQANANAAVSNYNRNNSPLGSAIRTGLSDITYLAGSFLGSHGMGMGGGSSSSPEPQFSF